MGCIEGRVSIQYFSQIGKPPPPASQKAGPYSNFAFKCHRHKKADNSSDVYSVNVIAFNKYNTLLTGGSDGCMTVWCKDTRSSVISYPKYKSQMPITAATYNSQATHLFYALSYDWSMGQEYAQKYNGCKIMLRPVPDSEIRKAKK